LHNVMDTIRTENQHHEEWVGNVLMGWVNSYFLSASHAQF
jgi:hypothetical protein